VRNFSFPPFAIYSCSLYLAFSPLAFFFFRSSLIHTLFDCARLFSLASKHLFRLCGCFLSIPLESSGKMQKTSSFFSCLTAFRSPPGPSEFTANRSLVFLTLSLADVNLTSLSSGVWLSWESTDVFLLFVRFYEFLFSLSRPVCA